MAKRRKNRKKCNSLQDFTVYDSNKKKPGVSVSNIIQNELIIEEPCADAEIPELKELSVVKIRKNQDKLSTSIDQGNDYHFDVWFIISTYIRPEDVGIFAAICTTSLKVVLSARFWEYLYKRYYRKELLPAKYQPECLLRYYGLRTAVIKALHLMYPPFIAKSREKSSEIPKIDTLIGKQCACVSTRKSGLNVVYIFKFKMNISLPFHRNTIKSDNIVDILDDIYANPEENYCIFEIISREHVPISPHVIGQTLKKGTLTLSKNCLYHKLKLIFGSSSGGNEELIIDSVCKSIIVNWWHPLYFLTLEDPYQNIKKCEIVSFF